MLTRTGWAVAIGSTVLVAAGRLLGIHELFLLGTGGATLVILTAAYVGLIRLRLDVARSLHPPRVYAGSASRVELRVRNLGRRRTPLLALRDPVGRGRSARVVLPPLDPGRTAQAAYRLPTERRGIIPIGPLHIDIADPFGLASLATPAAPVAELTVFPKIDDVEPLPHTMGDDPHAGTDTPNALGATGEEFYALRQYELGDDLRRVHWRATARHDELMVRQDEMPWQGRATILLDVRSGSHTPDTLEQAVSAAASLVMACRRRRFLLRLMSTDGHDSGFAAGHGHVEDLMEYLATVQPSDRARLDGMLASLRGPGNGGALVMLLGGRRGVETAGVAPLRRVFGLVTTVVFAPDRAQAAAGASGSLLVVDSRTTFPQMWNGAMRSRSRAGAGVRADTGR